MAGARGGGAHLPGKIGDLVLMEAGGRQRGAGAQVQIGQQVLGGLRQDPPPHLGLQRRSPLQGQLVQGQVVVTQPQRRLQAACPGLAALPRQPKDEVEGDAARKELPCRLCRRPRLRRRVLPAQQPQLSVVQGLRMEHGGSGAAWEQRAGMGWLISPGRPGTGG